MARTAGKLFFMLVLWLSVARPAFLTVEQKEGLEAAEAAILRDEVEVTLETKTKNKLLLLLLLLLISGSEMLLLLLPSVTDLF